MSLIGTERTNWAGLLCPLIGIDRKSHFRASGTVLPSTQVGIHAILESGSAAASAATVRVSTENNFRARFPITLREQCGPSARQAHVET
jgi:hypothetical protein